ncbi:MAG: aldo/keto reductase [Burkholderiales bacterium]
MTRIADTAVMARRRIGSAGLEVTEIGFGSAPIGNFRYNTTDVDAQAAQAALWAGGGRLYDTSPFYGYGRAEQRVGRFLQSVDAREYVLSTKVGRWMRPLRATDDTTGMRRGGLPFFPTFDVSYDGAMRSLEHSFLRLGLDRIDIVLIHDVDAFTHGSDAAAAPLFDAAMEGAYRALDELRRNGQVRAIGAGINDTRWCRRFVEAGNFDCMMLAGQYTLLNHPQEALDFIDLCRSKNVKLMLAAVFNSGLLAAGSASGALFNYGPVPAEVMERLRRIEAVAAAHGVPLNAAAIQFVLANPVVASAVLGATSAAEVAGNLSAYRQQIPAAFWSDLRNAGLIDRSVPLPGGAT